MAYKIKVLSDKEVTEKQAFSTLESYEASQVVVAQTLRSVQLNYRQSNAHTKTRGEVSGGGKKPWRQKGTGRARHGSTRSPIWVGGGVTHGPRNTRNWHSKINKSAKIATLKLLIKSRLTESKVFQIADDLKLTKTKSANRVFDLIYPQRPKNLSTTLVYTTADKLNLTGFKNLDITLLNSDNLKLDKIATNQVLLLTQKSFKAIENKIK